MPEFWREICVNFDSYVGISLSVRQLMEALRVFAEHFEGAPTNVHLFLPALDPDLFEYFNTNQTYEGISKMHSKLHNVVSSLDIL